MTPAASRLAVMMRALLWLCVVLVVVHAAGGHAHADVLAPSAVEHHTPGDDHHDEAGGSCDAARSAAGVDPGSMAALPPAIAWTRSATARTTRSAPAPSPLPPSPLFLLHTSLLI